MASSGTEVHRSEKRRQFDDSDESKAAPAIPKAVRRILLLACIVHSGVAASVLSMRTGRAHHHGLPQRAEVGLSALWQGREEYERILRKDRRGNESLRVTE